MEHILSFNLDQLHFKAGIGANSWSTLNSAGLFGPMRKKKMLVSQRFNIKQIIIAEGFTVIALLCFSSYSPVKHILKQQNTKLLPLNFPLIPLLPGAINFYQCHQSEEIRAAKGSVGKSKVGLHYQSKLKL